MWSFLLILHYVTMRALLDILEKISDVTFGRVYNVIVSYPNRLTVALHTLSRRRPVFAHSRMYLNVKPIISVTGFILNLLLLYLIRRFSTKELGTYKYLLEIFATYDTYLAVVHHITNPVRSTCYSPE